MAIARKVIMIMSATTLSACSYLFSSYPAPDPNKVRLEARQARVQAEQEAAAKVRTERQEAERRANEASRLAAEQRAADVKAGRQPIETAKDAEVYFDAVVGEDVLFTPPVAGEESQYYSVHGWITYGERDTYISWWPDMDWSLPQVGFAISGAKVIGTLRYRQPVQVVSKFVRSRAIPLASGGTAMIPVFEGGYIFAKP